MITFDLKPICLDSGLYIVATPIGNLKDITLRALETLSSVDRICCEDTRVSQKLLKHYGIQTKLDVYNDHSTPRDRAKIIERIAGGQSIALVSDAGTPLISDPGYKLVRAAFDANIYVTSLPGPSAAITALTLSGLPTDQFLFVGFLPSKSSSRKIQLATYQNAEQTIILYERGSRLSGTLEDIYETLGACQVAITREISKRFEQAIHRTLDGQNHTIDVKGEVVLTIRTHKAQHNDDDLIASLKTHLKTLRTRDAVDATVAATGAPRKHVYQLALSIKDA